MSRRTPDRRWWLGPATLVAIALALGGCEGTSDKQASTEENYRRAERASEAVVASLVIPQGSMRLEGAPEGWPESNPSLGPSDQSLTRTVWWSIPLGEPEVAEFLTDHAPPGMEHPESEEVVAENGTHGIASTEYVASTPRDPTAYTDPNLLLQFKQLGDITVLRADTFLAARYAVPEVNRLRSDVLAVEIYRRQQSAHRDGTPTRTRFRLSQPDDAALIQLLVDGFNALPGSITASGFQSCPVQLGPPPRDTVKFTTSTSDIVATLEPGCSGQVNLHVDGQPLDVTLDPDGWGPLLDEVTQGIRDARSARDQAIALAVARDQIDAQEATILSATFSVRSGKVLQSNMGRACTSGRLVDVKLIGSFPHIVTPGNPVRPGEPEPDFTVRAMLITADARSGVPCRIGVQTAENGEPQPKANAVTLDLD